MDEFQVLRHDQAAGQTALENRPDVFPSVGDQAGRRGGAAAGCSVFVIKRKATSEEEYRVRFLPYVPEKPCRFCSGSNQRYTIPVIAKLVHPTTNAAPVWWIEPDPSMPLLGQAIVRLRVMLVSR